MSLPVSDEEQGGVAIKMPATVTIYDETVAGDVTNHVHIDVRVDDRKLKCSRRREPVVVLEYDHDDKLAGIVLIFDGDITTTPELDPRLDMLEARGE